MIVKESLKDILKGPNLDELNSTAMEIYGVPYDDVESKLKEEIKNLIPDVIKPFFDVLSKEEDELIQREFIGDDAGFSEHQYLILQDSQYAEKEGQLLGGAFIIIPTYNEKYIAGDWLPYPEKTRYGLKVIKEIFDRTERDYKKYILPDQI